MHMKDASLTLDLFCDGNTMPELPWSEWEEKILPIQCEEFYHQSKKHPSFSFCRFFKLKNIKLFHKLSNEGMKWIGLYRNQFPSELKTIWTVAHFFRYPQTLLSIHLSKNIIHFLHDMGFKFDYYLYPNRGATKRKTRNICLSIKGNKKNENKIKHITSYPIQDRKILIEKYTRKESVTGIFFYGEHEMVDLHEFLTYILQCSKEQSISWKGVNLKLDYFPQSLFSGLRLYEDTIEILSQLNVSVDVTIHTPEKLCQKEYPLYPLFKKFQRHLTQIAKQ